MLAGIFIIDGLIAAIDGWFAMMAHYTAINCNSPGQQPCIFYFSLIVEIAWLKFWTPIISNEAWYDGYLNISYYKVPQWYLHANIFPNEYDQSLNS